MTSSPQNKKPESSAPKTDYNDWPELELTKSGPNPEQAISQTLIKIRAENSHKRLIMRTKALQIVVILALLSIFQSAFQIVHVFMHSEPRLLIWISTCSIVLQLATAMYFLQAKDPETAENVLRLLLILNVMVLIIGFWFALFGSSLLTTVNLILFYICYKRMSVLKYGGD